MAVSIACFGSLNRDLTVFVPRFPRPDETLVGHSVTEFRGGKGFNQAMVAARMGAAATMIGAVGRDPAGDGLIDALAGQGVNHFFVERADDVATGTAVPLVSDDGTVSIVIVPGANATVSTELADRAAEAIAAADVLLLQGEVDVNASARAAAIAREADVFVIVNPAPVGTGTRLLLPHANLVVANREEAAALELAPSATMIITMGGDGALVDDVTVPAFAVDVVDPTGAGDTFCGALAVALAEGAELLEAVRFANAAGACAVQVAGAEPSLPTRVRVDELMGQDEGNAGRS